MTPEEYGSELQRLWPATRHLEPESLYRRLRRMECKLDRLNTAACNQAELTERQIQEEINTVEAVKRLLWGADAYEEGFWPKGTPHIRFNSDPRGYALKIRDDWMRENRDCRLQRDMGGYGLIAPELDS